MHNLNTTNQWSPCFLEIIVVLPLNGERVPFTIVVVLPSKTVYDGCASFQSWLCFLPKLAVLPSQSFTIVGTLNKIYR